MHKRMWGIMGNMACCSPGVQVLSMRDAVFIVSPKMLNLGSLLPTTPLTQGPVWMPMRITTGVPSFGIRTCAQGAEVRASEWSGRMQGRGRMTGVPSYGRKSCAQGRITAFLEARAT